LDKRVERGSGERSSPTPAEQDGRHCLRRRADHITMIYWEKRGEPRGPKILL